MIRASPATKHNHYAMAAEYVHFTRSKSNIPLDVENFPVWKRNGVQVSNLLPRSSFYDTPLRFVRNSLYCFWCGKIFEQIGQGFFAFPNSAKICWSVCQKDIGVCGGSRSPRDYFHARVSRFKCSHQELEVRILRGESTDAKYILVDFAESVGVQS